MIREKKRLDILLVEKNFFETRQKAQSAIMAGIVFVNGNKSEKAGTQTYIDSEIEIKGNTCPYVSRGGLKLEKALNEFNIDIKDKICIDAGASSGGFTDCMLQHGASFVYAVDVGYGQIDWKLRNDDRVKVIERTNIRHLTPDILYETSDSQKASVCTIDLSFISVTKVLENIYNLMAEEKNIILLIKPQFEAGRTQVPKTGVVKDKKVHFDVISTVFKHCTTINIFPANLTYSPIKGPSGNIEYLSYLTAYMSSTIIDNVFIQNVIDKAHQELN